MTSRIKECIILFGVIKMKNFFEDFKKFIARGNIVDMAVGVVIGGAFGKIVTSLVTDIITPLISLITGKVSFVDLKWVIKAAEGEAAEVALTYGNFLQSIIDFLIIAFSIFVVLRIMMNAQKKMDELKKKEEEVPAEPEVPAENELDVLKDIRAMLEKENNK